MLPVACQFRATFTNYKMLYNLTSDYLDLGNTVAITEQDTNLRRRSTLPGELDDLLDNLVGGGFQPGGRGAGVGDGGIGDTLAIAVHATHFGGVVGGLSVGGGVVGAEYCALEVKFFAVVVGNRNSRG